MLYIMLVILGPTLTVKILGLVIKATKPYSIYLLTLSNLDFPIV